MQLGISALTCYLHACRHQNEAKSRKYLAKVLWLLSYDKDSQLSDSVEKYNQGVPALSWLPWIPQLLTCLVRNEGKIIVNILSQIGRTYPQAVYFPIRTLYLTLKMEQREKNLRKATMSNVMMNTASGTMQSNVTSQTSTTTLQSTTITVTPTILTIGQQVSNNVNIQSSTASSNETTTSISVTPSQNNSTSIATNQGSNQMAVSRPSNSNVQQMETEPSNDSNNQQQTNLAQQPATTQIVTTQSQQQTASIPTTSTPVQQSQQIQGNIINPQLQQRIILQQQSENQIKVTPPMWRCSKVLHNQRELHPTVLSSLEGIIDQLNWFRENWHEEVLRQLKQGLAKCYSIAFENRNKIMDATVTPALLNFVRKLVSTFGIGIENPLANTTNQTNLNTSTASESLARRAQATAQDPLFQRMKQQFTTDFDFEQPGECLLLKLIF